MRNWSNMNGSNVLQVALHGRIHYIDSDGNRKERRAEKYSAVEKSQRT